MWHPSMSTDSDNGLVPKWRPAIIWTNDGLLYWCMYASVGLNELSNDILPIWYQTLIQIKTNLFTNF